MLKTVFIGSRNKLNQILVHWLAARTEVVGVVWIQASSWQESWRGHLRFARQRRRRYGLWKVIDETLFYLYTQRFLRAGDKADLRRRVYEPYWARHGQPVWDGDALEATDVNAPEVLAFLEERQPDVAFAVCINNYFGEAVRAIPAHGVLLWHEGFTPEYKGLYSPFWAVYNLDFERIGYTLLRMNDKLDAGEIFVQGPARDIDPLVHHTNYLGHKAVADSLPAVERFLKDLEAGTARPIDRSDAPSAYYTYPGLTDYIRQRWRLRRWARRAENKVRTQPAEAQPVDSSFAS